jgi:capsular polysaccharide biosynthesis protein
MRNDAKTQVAPYTDPAMAVEDPPFVRYPGAPQQQAPRLGVLEAILRSLPLVILPVLLLVGGAVAYGLSRSPTYTSEARLNVGGLGLTTQTIPGYTTAVQQLSVAYSRAIDAPSVVKPVARKFKLTQRDVANRVSATPIQGSPVIRVRATSKHADQARRIADATATSLVNYAIDLNRGSADSKRFYNDFKKATREVQNAGATAQGLKPGSAKYKAAKTREDIARLNAQTAGALYQRSIAGQSTLNLVQKLTPAAPATSDRDSVLQQFIAGGLIAGLLIGIGLAVLRANRLTSRRLGAR